MKIEEYFSKIDLNEIERFIEESQEEHITLEFKTVNHPIYTDENREDDKKNFSKVISGFANSSGGIVVWGIMAKQNSSGQDVAKAKKPIKELTKFLNTLNRLEGNAYRGINVFLLASLGFQQNYFLTYFQAKDIGADIKSGERPSLVVFWKWLDKKNSEESEDENTSTTSKRRPLLRYYQVYNISQCENIPTDMIPQESKRETKPISECERIVAEMPNPPMLTQGGNACYIPKIDTVMMPLRQHFKNSEGYYSTLFHELIHSTGHQSRLNRKDVMQTNKMDVESYSQEELVAEIGACFLNSFSGIGIQDFRNNIAYIKGWLEQLQNDRKFIIYASAGAQKAVDYILNTTVD